MSKNEIKKLLNSFTKDITETLSGINNNYTACRYIEHRYKNNGYDIGHHEIYKKILEHGDELHALYIAYCNLIHSIHVVKRINETYKPIEGEDDILGNIKIIEILLDSL